MLKTFHDWKKNGYLVKKGAKAKLLWGQKIRTNYDAETQTKIKDEEESYKFFPIAFVFSENDVVKIPENEKVN